LLLVKQLLRRIVLLLVELLLRRIVLLLVELLLRRIVLLLVELLLRRIVLLLVELLLRRIVLLLVELLLCRFVMLLVELLLLRIVLLLIGWLLLVGAVRHIFVLRLNRRFVIPLRIDWHRGGAPRTIVNKLMLYRLLLYRRSWVVFSRISSLIIRERCCLRCAMAIPVIPAMPMSCPVRSPQVAPVRGGICSPCMKIHRWPMVVT